MCPPESSTSTVTEPSEAPTAAVAGREPKAICVATVTGVMLNEPLSTDKLSVASVAVRLKPVPAVSIERGLNVATP